MCRISYERCVCFVFLVILAVLSCSGFRIDNLAMTDISKRNSRGDVALDELRHHRVRHHRQPPEPLYRPQRSSDRRRPRGPCSETDVSWKAYKAAVVVVAKAESKSSKCRDNCTVFFKVIETLKNSSYPVDERIRLRFSSDRGAHGQSCDIDDPRHHLVRTKIDQAKEYILFLDTDGAHNFNAVFVPQIRRNKNLVAVRRVLSPNFRPRPVKLESQIIKPENKSSKHNKANKRLKLICKVKGFPIPIIYWKRNDSILQPQNSRYRIKHKRKRSTLSIQDPKEADTNSFQCVVRGVDGNEIAHTFTPDIDRGACNETMNQVYCFHGGRCKYIVSMNEYMCECADGYTGERCAEKLSRGPCPEPYDKNYCFNGGKCFLEIWMEEYMCECPDGFTGRQCEQKSSDQSMHSRH